MWRGGCLRPLPSQASLMCSTGSCSELRTWTLSFRPFQKRGRLKGRSQRGAELTPKVEYPPFAKNRGPGFWLKPQNWFAARRALRFDKSNDWRDANERAISTPPPGMWSRTTSIETLVPKNPGDEIRVIVLADTGEGDRSQYGLLPLIRAL